MSNNKLVLLDCTLRDGGYINDWKWGYQKARDIIHYLVKARVDIIEVGFLRNVAEYDPDITVCRDIEGLNRLLPDNRGDTMFAAMAMRSNYNIKNLKPYSGSGIELIRITAHDYDIREGLEYAAAVNKLGYKVSINPINIMGYSDEELLWILKEVNRLHPYQFSIVDTFGSMKRRDMERIVRLADHNLDSNIRLALHLHENMSLSFSLAQSFMDYHLSRPAAVDASLMGIGRNPGNLPIELISDYMNDYSDKAYDMDYMMDAIQEYIQPMKGESKWGYTPTYFLSAHFNLHRNYAEYYLGKGDLTNRDIHHILSRIDKKKANVFDPDYAESMYREYNNNETDDTAVLEELKKRFSGRDILIIAPGATLISHKDSILSFTERVKPITISVNFIPDFLQADFAFFGNNQRYSKHDTFKPLTIMTSNIHTHDKADYLVNYNRLEGAFSGGCNSLILLLKLMGELNIAKVFVTGADGYKDGKYGYYAGNMGSHAEHGEQFNADVARSIKKLGIQVEFITPSSYAEYIKQEG